MKSNSQLKYFVIFPKKNTTTPVSAQARISVGFWNA